MAEQDYEIWSVTVPYLSAGDLMNLYFDFKNIPTPNRMNWKDAETDQWLKAGRSALTRADRAKYLRAGAAEGVTTEHLWMPVLNINMHLVTNKKLKGAQAAHDLPEHLLQGARLVALAPKSARGSRARSCAR